MKRTILHRRIRIMMSWFLKTRARQPIYDDANGWFEYVGWCRLYKLENNAIISVTREGQYYIDICLGMIISSIDRNTIGHCINNSSCIAIIHIMLHLFMQEGIATMCWVISCALWSGIAEICNIVLLLLLATSWSVPRRLNIVFVTISYCRYTID